MNTDKEMLGEKLMNLRDSLNLSQKEIASSMGCTQGTISKIERGTLKGKFLVQYITLLQKQGVDTNDIFKS